MPDIKAKRAKFNEIVERYAIRCALGNNGGGWATHYTKEQKAHWRKFVTDLIADMLEEIDDFSRPEGH